ncbi:MAG TPA: DUF2505 domain-containing protein [Nocardioides sp.]|uniref:DUF2505 domain-containing protein n=1 Tax=Nocardioides sp. TaxID=35761 RepID=UPI002EDB2E9C
MSTPLTHELTYDAPLETVSAMLADPAFREAVCDAQHAVSRTVTVADGRVSIDYTQLTQGVPSFARKIVSDRITISQREIWSAPDAATVTMAIPGKPGEITGTVRLSEAGGVTTERVRLDVRVSMPLVGGKIEGLIADLLRKALAKENQVGREWLSR